MTCNELTRKRLNHSHLEIVRHDCGHHDGHLCTCKPDFINCPNLVRKIIYIFVIFRIFRDIIWLLFRQRVRVNKITDVWDADPYLHPGSRYQPQGYLK